MRQQQQGEFSTALGQAHPRDTEERTIRGRTPNAIWSEMAKRDDETVRAILQFVSRRIGGTR